jgi:molybdate transport system substrate-binding protein
MRKFVTKMTHGMRRPAALTGFLVILLIGLLVLLSSWGRRTGQSSLRLACAAGLREPVSEIVAAFEQETGLEVEVRFGGSGELAGQLTLSSSDLYLPADEDYLRPLEKDGRIAAVFDLVMLEPGLVVARGNPLGLESLETLQKEGLRISLADRSAAIGRLTWRFLEESGQLPKLSPQVVVTRPTVNGVVEDVAVGAADAAFAWDRVALNYAEVEWLPLAGLSERRVVASLAVMKSTNDRASALRFARYLADPDRGGRVFARLGYQLARRGEEPSLAE